MSEARATHHSLKVWLAPFIALWQMDKAFEIRKNDRGFEVGDSLLLEEWDENQGGYTGRSVQAHINFIVRGGEATPWGEALADGWCVMSIEQTVREDNGSSSDD